MTWSERQLRFIVEVRNIVDNLDRGGVRQVPSAMRLFDEIGAVPGIHVGKNGMTQFEMVEWYAGQVMDCINARAWPAMGQILNAINLYVPSPAQLEVSPNELRDASLDSIHAALDLMEPMESAGCTELLQYITKIKEARYQLGNLIALIDNGIRLEGRQYNIEVLREDWSILWARETRVTKRVETLICDTEVKL